MTLPSTRPPGITSCIRFKVRRKVDLPQPDGPMNAVTERGSTVIVTSSTALQPPYKAFRSSMSMRSPMSFRLPVLLLDGTEARHDPPGDVEDEDQEHERQRRRPHP